MEQSSPAEHGDPASALYNYIRRNGTVRRTKRATLSFRLARFVWRQSNHGGRVKDYEFRCLEEFLKNSGVECRRFMDKGKVYAFRESGAELLFCSFFGENQFTGEAGTIVLARNSEGAPLSAALLYAVGNSARNWSNRKRSG